MRHKTNTHPSVEKKTMQDISAIISDCKKNNIIKYRYQSQQVEEKEVFSHTSDCARYIWKTRETWNSMYDANFLLGVLINAWNYYQQTGKKATIVQAIWLYNTLQSQKDKSVLSWEKQKKIIEKIRDTYLPKESKSNIHIQTIQDMHPELFNVLEKSGIDWLKTDTQIPLDEKNINALTIAKYLYRCMEHNKHFERKIQNLKKWLEKNDELNDYYGMIEIACRLTDLLNGIDTQCGEVRQNLYDDRIKFIINGNISKYPELSILQKYIQAHLVQDKESSFDFSTIYLDGKQFDQYINNLQHKKDKDKLNTIKSMAKIWLLTLWLGVAAFAGKSAYNQYQKDSFIEQKQQQIQENLLLSYTPEQVSYFNEHINKTKEIIRTFYGIKDDGYINGLIRPYMMANPDLVDYIMKQKWNYGDISPISTSISEYIAMLIMKDQEKHNFLEYFGDDALGYKKFDTYMPYMLNTLQYYDSIYAANDSYEINLGQELKVREVSTSSTGASPMLPSSNYRGTWIISPWTQASVYTINHPTLGKKDNWTVFLVADDDLFWLSTNHTTKQFVENYLSYRHQTKYIARQVSDYVNQQLQKNNADLDKSEWVNRIHPFEHIIQNFVLHWWDTKRYLQEENIWQKAFEDIIAKNQKCIKYFRDHILIDLETMEKLPWYERRRWTWAMQWWESNAYRNNPEYQKANKDFFRRD